MLDSAGRLEKPEAKRPTKSDTALKVELAVLLLLGPPLATLTEIGQQLSLWVA